ncbi:MAG TPA: sugar transferase [Pirellulales bacterium]|nr:sugar transferase [Pirellulales bacterium]
MSIAESQIVPLSRARPRVATVRSVEQFREALLYERARSDRSGHEFSLVAFSSGQIEHVGAMTRRLATTLAGRLRAIDQIGWLADGRLAALLPYTPPEGAWKVADDICLGLPDRIAPPVVEVFVYPSGWLADDSNDSPANSPHECYVPLEPFLTRPLPVWKRALDVFGAGTGLLLLSPLMALLAAAVKLSSPGPVFFRQRRAGRGGRPFVIYKFRTMVADAEARQRELLSLNEQDGPAFKIKRDPRVTRLGRLLRATSLDELPQLFNVLRGDMSLVGPRPLPCHESDACIGWRRRRLEVTPGLTCIWQVRGRSRVSFDEWMRMDLRYSGSRSLRHDLKLLIQTVWAVVRGTGAH